MLRSITTINQQMPGPSIQVCEGDRIIVDVMNMIDGVTTAIHWHGQHQKGTPWMDGVPMVTQCPITAMQTFRYQFRAAQAGTQFYHSHSGVQRLNGAQGGLVVRQACDPNAHLYDYDLVDHYILLSDWNNFVAESWLPGIRNSDTMPDSLLINGFGSYTNLETNQTSYAPIAVFYCQKECRYRFRICNGGGHHCPMEFSVCIWF